MDHQKAIDMIFHLAWVETSLAQKTNTGRGIGGLLKQEQRAVSALFKALTGEEPTEDEIAKMIVS